MVVTALLYVLGWGMPAANYYLMACPLQIMHFQLWRLVTSFLVQGNLLNLLFSLYIFFQVGKRFELEVGTVMCFCCLIIFTFLTNLVFVLASSFLAVLMPGLVRGAGCSQGIFTFVLSLMVITTQRSEQETMSFWGMCNIPTKIYPFFLVLILALMGGQWLDNLCAVFIGFLHHWERLNPILPSTINIETWEQHPKLRAISSAPGFVSSSLGLVSAPGAGGASGAPTGTRGGGFFGGGGGGTALGRAEEGRSATSSAAPSAPASFSGKGQALGGSSGGTIAAMPTPDEARRVAAEAAAARLQQSAS
jgi:membrane associated rhomboid family serine protease